MPTRKFIVILFSALCSLFTTASAAETDSDTRPMWGVKAAFDINIPGKWHGDAGSVSMYRHGFGGTVGTVCNIYLGKNFYLEPGLSLFYDSYSHKDLIVVNAPGELGEEDPSLYKVGLRIPVVAGYSFNIGENLAMSVYTGPELSYAFAGDIRFKDADLKGEIGLFGKNGNQKRIDCAWEIGVGFPVNEWFISIDAALGMTDLLKGGMSFRENRCTVGLTRYF